MTYQGETEFWRPRPSEPQVFLSTLAPERKDRWLALAVVVISTAVFWLAVPVAKRGGGGTAATIN